MTAPLNTNSPTHVWVLNATAASIPKRSRGNSHVPPIYREHWVKHEIIGETSRSWLITEGWRTVKIPKRGASRRRFLFSEKDVDDNAWANDHRYRIEQLIQTLSPEKLRQVAELIGYEATT
jgi:hypothetical protein